MKFEELREEYPNISLKRICEEAGLCYQYILKASKLPIPNQAYDATAFNYEAVQKIVDRKEIKLEDIDWKSINDSIKTFEPINQPADFSGGQQTEFKLRTSDEVYKVVYTTVTHVVFVSINEDNTQPRVMNWDTFLHQSPRILK